MLRQFVAVLINKTFSKCFELFTCDFEQKSGVASKRNYSMRLGIEEDSG